MSVRYGTHELMIHPEATTERQSELGDRRAPFASWHLPAFPNLSRLQPNELRRHFVAWQVPAGTNREKRTETWTRLCIHQHSAGEAGENDSGSDR
jgi:hypothetical protein